MANDARINHLKDLLREVAREKRASAQIDDPGGMSGKSTHPSADADGNVQEMPEGRFSSEQSTKVKSDQGKTSVDATPDKKPNDTNQDDYQISGESTGSDPATEDGYKGTKDDPGTSHPATTEDGEKYGRDASRFESLVDQFRKKGNTILAKVAAAQMQPYGQQQDAPHTKTASAEEQAAMEAEAGYALASCLGMEKLSADERAAVTVHQTYLDALQAADNVIAYVSDHVKRANDELAAQMSMLGAGGPPGAEGMPPGAEGMPPVAEGMPPDAEGMPPDAEGMPPGAEGMPPDAEGMPPDAEGMPPGEEGGEGDAPMDEKALQELLMALQEAGIPLDELAAAGPEGADLAKEASAFQRAGKFQFREAKTAIAREWRNRLKQHVIGLVKGQGGV